MSQMTSTEPNAKIENKLLKNNKMRAKRQNPKVSKERAIQIAMNHNCISRAMAEQYTDSELREVCRQLHIRCAF